MISDNSEALANQIDTICMDGKNSVGGCLLFLSRFIFFSILNERHVKLQELYVTNMMINLKFALCGLMHFHDDGSKHVS